MARIVKPTVAAMAARGTPYMGVLYAGLMITKDGPKLIEYNCRFGDPECQVLMMRLKSDLATALLAARDKQLASSRSALARRGGADRGDGGEGLSRRIRTRASEIRGLEEAAKVEGVQIFHAGTERRDGKLIATGGRVLNVTALGQDRGARRRRVPTQAVDLIDWPGGFCRRDIGWRAVARERG